jgi:hypothetical protein
LELIKDYELEIHYHPEKINVVASALSRKEHCNHIMVQPVTSGGDPEEPSLRVIPHGVLHNLTLIPTIKEDIITARKQMLGWGTSKEGCNWVKQNVFMKMSMECYGSRTV